MKPLGDQYGRIANYLRLSITDRCNLRCQYCMPAEGINYVPRAELMSYEELLHLSSLFINAGIKKIRITGGEPFVRKDLMYFLGQLSTGNNFKNIHITTNGTLTGNHLDDLIQLGIRSINLSIDSLSKENFEKITRRKEFHKVEQFLYDLIKSPIQAKINVVVQPGVNDHEIPDFLKLAGAHEVEVRFIEAMPFNGVENDLWQKQVMTHDSILDMVKNLYPDVTRKTHFHRSSWTYHIPGFKGNIGIIPAFTRKLCGSCNRLRLTSTGWFKTCLYGEGVLNLKDMMREGMTDKAIENSIRTAVYYKFKTGNDAEVARVSKLSESMSEIGG